jgi:hypothetical protein
LVVTELNTFGNATAVNSSNQNVWVQEIFVSSTKPHNDLRWDINATIEPRKVFSQDLVSLSAKQFTGTYKDRFGNIQDTYATDLGSALVIEIGDKNYHTEKYLPVYLKQDGPEHSQMAKFFASSGQKYVSFPCNARLTYVFMDSQAQHSEQIPCIGIIKHRRPETVQP